MVRFNDKPQITTVAGNDIIPMTDVSESRDDKKITVDQLSDYTMTKVDTALNKNVAIPNYSSTATYSKDSWVAGKQFDLSKFTVVGNPTISEDGVIEGKFAYETNYVQSKDITLSVLKDKSWTFECDLKFNMDGADTTSVLLSGTSTIWRGIKECFIYYQTEHCVSFIYGTGTTENHKYDQDIRIYLDKSVKSGIAHCKVTFDINAGTYALCVEVNDTKYDNVGYAVTEVKQLAYIDEHPNEPLLSTFVWNGEQYMYADLSSIRITVDGEEVFSGLSDEKSIYQSKVDNNTGHDLGNEEYWENIGVKKPEVAITTYDSKASYSENAWVVGEVENEKSIFKSLIDNNIGHALDDEDYWEELKLGGGGSGLEVCDIGISLFVDETKGLRRYLNGSIVAINKNTSYFAERLKAISTQYPSLTCTETEWQAIASSSVGGQCGKFVIDEVAGTIRLPRIVMPIQGLTDLSKLAEIVEAGLPNITGSILGNIDGATTYGFGQQSNGAFQATNQGYAGYARSTLTDRGSITFDASRASSIYGNSNTVQQEQIQYPYFIQIATGAETEYEITNEHMINQPFSLFDSKYSDIEIYNASWLKSNNQWNSGATYVTAYEALVVEQNTAVLKGQTVTLPTGNVQYIKRGVSVKLSTASDITDYDFVINTTNKTFRLPIKSHLASGKAVVGNGIAIGLENSKGLFGLKNRGDYLGANANYYGATVGATPSDGSWISSEASTGLTTDPDKSGIETADNNLYLYYFVGDTLVNPSLIATENILNTVAGMSKSYLVESYTNGTSWYRVFSDGWCEQGGLITSANASTITLLKTMIDTNYSILLSGSYGVNGTDINTVVWSNKTTASFKYFVYISSGTTWVVRGYTK